MKNVIKGLALLGALSFGAVNANIFDDIGDKVSGVAGDVVHQAEGVAEQAVQQAEAAARKAVGQAGKAAENATEGIVKADQDSGSSPEKPAVKPAPAPMPEPTPIANLNEGQKTFVNSGKTPLRFVYFAEGGNKAEELVLAAGESKNISYRAPGQFPALEYLEIYEGGKLLQRMDKDSALNKKATIAYPN